MTPQTQHKTLPAIDGEGRRLRDIYEGVPDPEIRSRRGDGLRGRVADALRAGRLCRKDGAEFRALVSDMSTSRQLRLYRVMSLSKCTTTEAEAISRSRSSVSSAAMTAEALVAVNNRAVATNVLPLPARK
jgi:hypothetical protein